MGSRPGSRCRRRLLGRLGLDGDLVGQQLIQLILLNSPDPLAILQCGLDLPHPFEHLGVPHEIFQARVSRKSTFQNRQRLRGTFLQVPVRCVPDDDATLTAAIACGLLISSAVWRVSMKFI